MIEADLSAFRDRFSREGVHLTVEATSDYALAPLWVEIALLYFGKMALDRYAKRLFDLLDWAIAKGYTEICATITNGRKSEVVEIQRKSDPAEKQKLADALRRLSEGEGT